jgi:hypothetical protein
MWLIKCSTNLINIEDQRHTQLNDGDQDIYTGDGDNLEPDDVDMKDYEMGFCCFCAKHASLRGRANTG